jgi:hypothetical protein
MATDRGWRPFWLHQGAEYLVALVLIASGLQSPEPLWPALAGGLVLVNAALSGPPLGAFRVFSRAQHRHLDVVVVAVLLVVAVLPFLNIDSASRLTIVVVALVRARPGNADLEALPRGFAGIGVAVIRGEHELRCRGLVDHHAGVRMELQRRRRKERRHRTLHGPGDRLGLGIASGDEHEMAGVQDRPDALGEHVAGNVVDRIEEPGVVDAGLGGECLQPRPRRQ